MRFLLALDLDREPLETLLPAQRLLGPLGLRFDLLYVDPARTAADFLAEPDLREEALALWDRHRIRWQNKLEMLLFRLPHAARGRALVEVGDPCRVILKLAADYDGVVVGGRARPPLSRSRASVADRIVQGSPVPVIMVRSPDPATRVEPLTAPLYIDDGQAEKVLPFRRMRRSSP